MKNTFGESVSVTLFGESHGETIGAVLDGLAPGVIADDAFIGLKLSQRRPQGSVSTKRVEPDRFRIVSGVYNGKTTGAPICIQIPNENVKSDDYTRLRELARPGHADYTARMKYYGFEDRRGGGHFSGRLTAPLVAVGAIAISALRARGIEIGTHVQKCAGISDDGFGDLNKDIAYLNTQTFAVLNDAKKAEMIAAIEDAAQRKDSVGGVLETAVVGVPAGVGEPWFDTLEGVLSHALFSIPAVKGVEFGAGFAIADMKGSEANDALRAENGKVTAITNHNGGINGGISNGMPIIFRCAVKPTPSIGISQETVDLNSMENAEIEVAGRHDPAIVHRARAVVDSISALVLCDQLALRFGTDWLGGKA